MNFEGTLEAEFVEIVEEFIRMGDA